MCEILNKEELEKKQSFVRFAIAMLLDDLVDDCESKFHYSFDFDRDIHYRDDFMEEYKTEDCSSVYGGVPPVDAASHHRCN